MVSLGTPKPCLPAVSKTYGKVEITLDPQHTSYTHCHTKGHYTQRNQKQHMLLQNDTNCSFLVILILT